MNNFIAILLVALIYLPGSTLGSIVRIGVVICVYFIIPPKMGTENRYEITKVAQCILISPFIPILFVAMSGEINTALIVHEIMRMFYCSILILTVSKLEISFNTIYRITVLALVPNFAIQAMEYIHFPGIIGLIQRYYVMDASNLVHLELATYSGVNFRSGSVFINPNVYMAIPMLAMCVFLYKDRIRPSFINTILIVVAVLSGFLTGSRTSIIVMVTVATIYYLKYASGFSKMFAIIAVFLVVFRYGSYLLSNSRALQVSDTGSFDSKYMSFIWYWQKTASMPLFWITGSLGSYMTTIMDSEWGYIYAWYGLFGLIWYIKYIKVMWYNNSNMGFYPKLITISCVMTAMTATLLLCMPIYSYVGLVALSYLKENDIYDDDLIIN